MSQAAINMHTSQISHGYLKGVDYENDDDNTIIVGYTPSMIKVMPLSGDDPVGWFYWYSTKPDEVYLFEHGEAPSEEDSPLEVNELGFVLDGADLDTILAGTADGIYWETYGCHNDDSYRTNMNPAAKAGDGAMDFIQPVVDPDAEDEESEAS